MGVTEQGFYIPGTRLDHNEQKLNEVATTIYNMRHQVSIDGGIKSMQYDNSKDTKDMIHILSCALYSKKVYVGIDDYTNYKPDIILASSEYGMSKHTYFAGIEHFCIGCRNKRKKGKLINVTQEFLNNMAYKEGATGRSKYSIQKINTKILNNTLSSLEESFKYGYSKHVKNIVNYRECIELEANKRNIQDKDNQLWLLVDNIDCILIYTENDGRKIEVPLVVLPDVLSCMDLQNTDIDGIIYLSMGGLFVISKEYLLSLDSNKFTKVDVIAPEDIQIWTQDIKLEVNNKIGRFYFMSIYPLIEQLKISTDYSAAIDSMSSIIRGYPEDAKFYNEHIKPVLQEIINSDAPIYDEHLFDRLNRGYQKIFRIEIN